MRTPFIAANWKMYKTVHETVAYRAASSARCAKDVNGVEIVLAPPFTALHAAARRRATATSASPRRTATGSARARSPARSAPHVREAGADYVIVGHSERRRCSARPTQSVNRKIARRARRGSRRRSSASAKRSRSATRNETLAVLDRQIKAGSTA